MDEQQAQRFADQPEVVLDAGEYTIRIEDVQVGRTAIRPVCIVVGGESDGKKVCPETYDFSEGGENRAAIRNLYGWGLTEEELTETGGDLKSIGALLVGRLGRVKLEQSESEASGLVNVHEPGAIEPVPQ